MYVYSPPHTISRQTIDESSKDEPSFFTVASLTSLSIVCPANKTLTKAETSPCNEASRTTQTHTRRSLVSLHENQLGFASLMKLHGSSVRQLVLRPQALCDSFVSDAVHLPLPLTWLHCWLINIAVHSSLTASRKTKSTAVNTRIPRFLHSFSSSLHSDY